MGKIASVIQELEPKYNALVKLARKVDTSSLQNELFAKVFNCFSALRPLSYKYREVGKAKVSYYRYYSGSSSHETTIAIGTWINTKSEWQEYGRGISDYFAFFGLIKEKGLGYIDYLRRPIRKDWETLVKLVNKLQSFDEVKVKLSFTEPIEIVDYAFDSGYYARTGKISINKMKIEGLALETQKPREFYLIGTTKKIKRALSDDSNIAMLEDIIDDLLALYKRADKRVSKVRVHNEPIVKQMEAIVKVWQISKSLKKGGRKY